MMCMCGDTDCPSCGTAQGAWPECDELQVEERNANVAEPFRTLVNGISALEVVAIEEAGRA